RKKQQSISKAIAEFNEKFRAFFGKEAGTFFDTNIYDKGEALAGAIQEGEAARGGAKPTIPTLMTDKGKQDNARVQDVAALLKVRKYIGDDAKWEEWGNAQLAMMTDAEARAELKQRLKEANAEHHRVQEAMAEKIKQLDPD